MEFGDTFIPTAASSGLLQTFTWYTMLIAMFSLLASVVFSWLSQTRVAPEHNISRITTAALCFVAFLSYYFIQDYYRHFLAATMDQRPEEVIREAYLAIGQLRYMDWTITTPLLLIKMFSLLEIKPREEAGLFTLAIGGDLFMIMTGYIGEQQIGPGGEVLVGQRLFWGFISTLGYLAVVYALYKAWKKYKGSAKPIERKGYMWAAGSVFTLWGVYPIGYMLVCLDGFNLDWIHLAFTLADIVNKVGVGVVAYLVGARVLEERIDMHSKDFAMSVG